MIAAQPTVDEIRRIAALRQYAVLDTPAEKTLDDITTLAGQICDAPIALISLVDENRQWFKARFGLEITETPRDISFCGHAVHQRDLFIVPDALDDERFAQNPMVRGELGIRFYAGAPLVNEEGIVLGTLCVFDHVPRTLTEQQQQALRVLARHVMTHLELRRHTLESIESEAKVPVAGGKYY
jgi:GAF domain-containing protein